MTVITLYFRRNDIKTRRMTSDSNVSIFSLSFLHPESLIKDKSLPFSDESISLQDKFYFFSIKFLVFSNRNLFIFVVNFQSTFRHRRSSRCIAIRPIHQPMFQYHSERFECRAKEIRIHLDSKNSCCFLRKVLFLLSNIVTRVTKFNSITECNVCRSVCPISRIS